MNKYHDKKTGKFTKKQKISFYAITVLVIAGILACAVVGAQDIYQAGSQRVRDFFHPKVETAVAETPEPTDMKEWVLWRVGKAGIDPYEAYMIIQKESKWNPEAMQWKLNDNGVDIGLWQINSYHHPEVKPSCSLDYKCATEAAIKIHDSWKGWGAWTTAKDLGLK